MAPTSKYMFIIIPLNVPTTLLLSVPGSTEAAPWELASASAAPLEEPELAEAAPLELVLVPLVL